MLDFRQLRHFLAVYEHRTYAGAAKSLGLTQQAVSASIAKLESTLSARLFDRDKTGARPTKAAGVLLPYARLLFADADRASEALDRFKGGETGTMRIGLAHVPEGGAIPRAIRRMHQERPAVAINLINGLIAELKDRLVAGEVDFMIGAPPSGWSFDSSFTVEKLFEATPCVACAAHHPLASRERMSLEDLVGYPWILPPPRSPFRGIVDKAFIAKGLEPPKTYIYSDAYAVAPALVALGDYLVITYPGLLDFYIQNGVFKILPVDVGAPTSPGLIVTRKGDVLDEPVKYLIDLIKEEVNGGRAAAPA